MNEDEPKSQNAEWPENAEKYPTDLARGTALKYSKLK